MVYSNLGAEGATAPETLRQKDREARQTLERTRQGSPTEQGIAYRSRNLSGIETAGALDGCSTPDGGADTDERRTA